MGIDLTQYPDSEYVDQAGDYQVCITSHRMVTANSGSKGVEYELTTNDHRKLKLTFWTSEKAMPRLVGFLKRCFNLDEDRLRDFEYDDIYGKGFIAHVEIGDRGYAEVTSTKPLASASDAPASTPAAPRPSAPRPSAPPSYAPSDSGENSNDDLPF